MTTIIKGSTNNLNSSTTSASSSNIISQQEYYVRVPKTKKRFHALKFHIPNFEFLPSNKVEMVRDPTNVNITKYEWQDMPKTGQGSEYNREQREMARRRKYGYTQKKVSPDDMPWILTSKGNDKKEKQYIGKKSITENSSYFVFVKCPDGGFEAHPLEDWYSFAAHKAYKTLNIEEAEEEFKRRHKILNKYLIMANKRKVDEDEEEEDGETAGTSSKTLGRLSKLDDDDSDDENKKKKKKNKSSNLSDEEDNDDEDEDGIVEKKSKTKKPGAKGKKGKGKKGGNGSDDDDEFKNKEDSDDGDAEGLELDYSSTSDEESSILEDDKNEEEKYEEKGVDEEEPIKALDKSSDDEDESEEDEDLTEEGKEYRKLMSKENEKKNEDDEFDELMRTGKTKIKDLNDDDSNSTFEESDLENEMDFSDKNIKKNKTEKDSSNKLKRKATDELGQPKSSIKKPNKNSASTPNMPITHDESSSSSTTSGAAASNMNKSLANSSKSSKTAAVIAAAAAAAQQSAAKLSGQSNNSSNNNNSNPALSEDEVRKYLTRKPMTTKELLQKFRSKTQNKLGRDELLESLRIILDRLKAKMIEKNGVKYLSL